MSTPMKRSTAKVGACLGSLLLVAYLCLACIKTFSKPYALELNFTGLCVLTQTRDEPAKIVLPKVDAETFQNHYIQAHLPRLTFWAKDVLSPEEECACMLGAKCACWLQSTPSGDEQEVCDLADKELSVTAPGNPALNKEGPYENVGEEPGSTNEEAKLDWTTPLKEVFPKWKPEQGIDQSAVSGTVTLAGGHLYATGLPWKSGHYVKWMFLDDAGKPDSPHKQALAGKMTLSITDLDRQQPVTISLKQGDYKCEIKVLPKVAAETILEASVSNLPEKEMGHPNDPLYHLAGLRKLVKWKDNEPILYPSKPDPPIKYVRVLDGRGEKTTSSVFCPPIH